MTAPFMPKRRAIAEINVVPYIDVMLVLLVVFMVTAPMLEQGVKVDLPDAKAAEITTVDESKLIIVTVNATGELFLNVSADPKAAQSLDVIESTVTKIIDERPTAEVYVRGDERVVYGRVVSVMAALQNAGVPNVGLITEGVK